MIYKHALVPLDGSPLAECVLPHLQSIAGTSLIEEVELIRVVAPLELHYKAASPIDAKQEHLLNQAARQEAEEYLRNTRDKLKISNAKVTTTILTGSAADALADHLKKSNADLLLLATHGRSGISRWIWGSVADKILRSSNIPVFLVRPPGCNTGI
jgi:nucleotide-binding universal stress UspA family protein